MSDQTTFTPEEWSQIRTAPMLVTTGVTAADPSGIFGSIKEAAAGMHAMIASLQAGGPSGLLGSLLADKSAPSLHDFKSMLGEGDKAKQMSNLKTAILGKIRGTLDILKQKASPEEVTSYTAMLSKVADSAANSAKEGGFLGFGGTLVSAPEQAFLDELKTALHT